MSYYSLNKNESIYLDFIRVLASQLVLVGHAISYFSIATYFHQPNFPWMQNIAVVIFFILSGFVITYSTNKKASSGVYSFKLYSIDRYSRIFAAFIPALLFVVSLDFISQSISQADYRYFEAFNLPTFIANLFMLQDYPLSGFTSFGSARPFWTISIEWWIYLFFGYVYFIVNGTQKLNAKTLVLLAFFAIIPCYNLIGGRGGALSLYWILGMLLCLIYPHYKLLKLARGWKVIFAISLIALAIARQYLIISAYDVTFALILSLFILVSMDLISSLNLNKIFAIVVKFFASYSFTLYLVHYSILDFIASHYIEHNPYILFIIGFIISNLIAICIARFTEIKLTPILKQKLKYYLATKNKCHG